MPPVSNHLRRLANQLFANADDRSQFIESLISPQPYDRAVLWVADRPDTLPFSRKPPFDWQPEFVDRAPAEERPGLHVLHEQGRYYCLEFSSVFAAMALTLETRQPEVVIDVCAAPGGKAIFAWRHLSPRRLVCNEVIRKRTGVLKANLQRCGVTAEVICRDSKYFTDASWNANPLPQADLVIVDAPCSGQSLIARGKPSPGCFHPAVINTNANRQKRILANSTALVRPGGWLAYMTCTFAQKENEGVVQWLLKRFDEFQTRPVDVLSSHQSPFTDAHCYRLWPYERIGAGAFTSLFQRT